MTAFTGKYFNGESEGPFAAEVRLTPAALQITYQTQSQAVPLNIYWQVHRLVKETPLNSGKIILRYGAYPGQTLEINELGFWSAFDSYYAPAPEAAPPNPVNQSRKGRGLGAIYVFFLGLLLLVPVIYFWLLPAAADMAARRIPPTYEQKLGRMLAKELLTEDKIDKTRTAGLRGFMRQLQLTKSADLNILVIKNTEPNAFALPGGTIVVHDAMIPLLKSPEELAALMGHEYGHITLRHSLRTLFRNLSGYFLISALFGDVSAIATVVLQNAHSFKSLAYSRAFEKEADKRGFEILLQNNLDPNGMVQLFEHLQQQNPNQAQQNEYLSSHPQLSSRIAYIKQLIKQNQHQVAPNDSLHYFFQQLKQ